MNYRVNVTNKSAQADFIIFQEAEGMYNAYPLAWLCRNIPTAGAAVFEWNAEYTFVCGEPGQLRPGTTFSTLISARANPNAENMAILEDNGRGMNFMVQPGGQSGQLQVNTSPGIQMGKYSGGFGRSGYPVIVSPLQPNFNIGFNVKVRLFIAAGTFRQGEVLNPNALSNKHELRFNGDSSLNITLNANNTWS